MTPTSEVIRLAKLAGFDASYTTPSGLEYVLAITELDEVNIFDQVARLISLAKAEALAEGWQPIETAPRTGKTLLLGYFNSHGNWRTLRGQWFSRDAIDETWEEPDEAEEGWYETPVEIDDTPNCFWTQPTHWMPLPPPPEHEGGHMTTFNPSHFEHEGVRYEANTQIKLCRGCAFNFRTGCKAPGPESTNSHCVGSYRPDRENIIWIKAQEENKS